MYIFIDATMPYELSKEQSLNYVIERCYNTKHSLSFINKTTEHLEVRCPVAGDYLELVGTESEINWIHQKFKQLELYRLT